MSDTAKMVARLLSEKPTGPLMVAAAALIEREAARLAEVEKDTTWQDHADYWQKRAIAAEARLAEAERDRDGGWKAFYALRKAVGEDRYPGLTGVVRTDPPIRPADSAGEKP